MVSLRCKMMVQSELEKLGIGFSLVELSMVEVFHPLNTEQRDQFRNGLSRLRLELLDDQKAILIERIKQVIIELIHYSDDIPDVNYSTYISRKLHYDYNYLSSIFSEVKGTTIQHYIIYHKIEKVKKLLLYNELNLTQIAYKLHYSSVAHLSNQFKKVTGLSPSFYKKLKVQRDTNLENL